MTTITFFRHGDVFAGYSASGHSGYGKYGLDILCAAISAMTQCIGQGIVEAAGAKADIRTDEDTGFYELILASDQSEKAMDRAQVLIKTLEISMVALTQDRQYSGNIRINYRERR